jgi:hypothetical protein
MPTQLLEWENNFRNISEIEADKKCKAGMLLQFVPDHTRWEDFLVSVKEEWHVWRKNLRRYPACLVILYSGLAFYESGDMFEFLVNLDAVLALRVLTGFFVAGVYPVGMKIASGWYQKGLGRALGFLVGALALGAALPYLLKGTDQADITRHLSHLLYNVTHGF